MVEGPGVVKTGPQVEPASAGEPGSGNDADSAAGGTFSGFFTGIASVVETKVRTS